MGAWGDFWDKVVTVAQTVGNVVVRATKATIDFVFDTAGYVAGKVADAGRAAIKSLGKDIEAIFDATGNVITKFVTKGIDVWFAIKRHYQEAKGGTTTSSAQYTTEENAAALNNIFIFSRGLLQLAGEIKNNPEMQRFDNFARISVSIMFLEDLLKNTAGVENKEKINVRFIDFINKFLSGNISKAEVAEFDELIKKTYNKSLLVIGSETLIAYWVKQENELKQDIGGLVMQISEQELLIAKLEKQIKNKTKGFEEAPGLLTAAKNKLIQLALEKETKTKECADNRDMAGVSKGLLLVMKSGGNLGKSLMTEADIAGNTLVRWKDGHTPMAEERNQIVKFNLLAEAERKRQEQKNQGGANQL